MININFLLTNVNPQCIFHFRNFERSSYYEDAKTTKNIPFIICSFKSRLYYHGYFHYFISYRHSRYHLHPFNLTGKVSGYQRHTFSNCTCFYLFTIYFLLVCCIGILMCIFFILYHALKIFSCIGKGVSPFTKTTSSQIRKIAAWIIIYGIISLFSIFKISFASFLLCCLFALIMLCISLIFDYGCTLQQEVDELL